VPAVSAVSAHGRPVPSAGPAVRVLPAPLPPIANARNMIPTD